MANRNERQGKDEGLQIRKRRHKGRSVAGGKVRRGVQSGAEVLLRKGNNRGKALRMRTQRRQVQARTKDVRCREEHREYVADRCQYERLILEGRKTIANNINLS